MTVQRGKDYLGEKSSQHHWKINLLAFSQLNMESVELVNS